MRCRLHSSRYKAGILLRRPPHPSSKMPNLCILESTFPSRGRLYGCAAKFFHNSPTNGNLQAAMSARPYCEKPGQVCKTCPGFLLFWEDSPKSCCFLHKFSPHLVFRQIPHRICGIMATRTTGAGEPPRQWHRPARPPVRMPGSSPQTPQTALPHPAMPGVRHPLRLHRR